MPQFKDVLISFPPSSRALRPADVKFIRVALWPLQAYLAMEFTKHLLRWLSEETDLADALNEANLA